MAKHEVVEIPDPELLLPDERLPPAHLYRAVSSFIGKDYVSLAALIRARQKAEYELNAGMTIEQTVFELPAHVWYRVTNGSESMMVFGYVPSPEGFLSCVTLKDEAARARTVRKLANAARRGWLYGRWHSATQPKGEWGVMHRTYIGGEISESSFSEMWPS